MEVTGAYTAMVTPFKNGEVDIEGLKKNIQFQIDEGIDGLLALGTTGEAPTINAKEQEAIIRTTVEEANGRVPVMVGTGTNDTIHAIENTKRAKDLGVDCALVVTPYYNKPTQEGIYLHFKKITESVDIPIVVYNIEGRTGRNIETATMKKLAKLPNIIGVKEASGNIGQIEDVILEIAEKEKTFNVMSGDDGLTFHTIALGGSGIISVVSNLVPGKLAEMTRIALSGDLLGARKHHRELLPLIRGAFIETNPIPIKTMMNLCRLPAGNARLPICSIQPENEEKLKKLLTDLSYIQYP